MPLTVQEKLGVTKAFSQDHYPDIEDNLFWGVCRRVFDYSLLPVENLWSLYAAVRYLSARKIPGDLVECGVFLGGSVRLMAETLAALRDDTRAILGYDTFTGFVRRSESDVTPGGELICDYQTPNFRADTESNLEGTPYREKIRLIEGDVTATLKTDKPAAAALVRLDTDSYDTTLAELEHLYPLLSAGGVLIIDDYGYCRGARQATDEYFRDPAKSLLFLRSDAYCRVAVKM